MFLDAHALHGIDTKRTFPVLIIVIIRHHVESSFRNNGRNIGVTSSPTDRAELCRNKFNGRFRNFNVGCL